jgi:hypothetical protein
MRPGSSVGAGRSLLDGYATLSLRLLHLVSLFLQSVDRATFLEQRRQG